VTDQKPKPTIVDDVGPELLASEIAKVARAAQALLASRLTRRAVILLIQDLCPGRMAQRDIESVLDAAAALERVYVKPAPKVVSNG
jgi:hypothetical protein